MYLHKDDKELLRDIIVTVSERMGIEESIVEKDYYVTMILKELVYWHIDNNKMLFAKSAIGDYYYMVGGGVHLGESSKSCIEREIYEETGMHTCAQHLAVVCENFFRV